MIERVALKTLRSHAVRRSLFAPTDLASAIDAMGFVQLDPIRAPARAADLILRQRVMAYRAGDLDRAYASLPLAEDYMHVYGVLPARSQLFLHPRVAGSWRVEREHPRLAAKIIAHVRDHGVTHPRDLHVALGKATTGNGWGGASAATTRMLEALQFQGKLRVARRDAGIRLYDLAHPRPRARAAGARAAELLALLLRLYAPLSESGLRRLARMMSGFAVSADACAAALERMLSSRTIRRVATDGKVFMLPADEAPRMEAEERVALLAPFDPVVWDRPRFEFFWGWEYRFEAYTPPAMRRFGYYALPLLWRDEVIGWANAAKVGDTLEVAAGFVKGRPRGAAFRRALQEEAAALAASVGATRATLSDA
ncbi:MAG TPA: crosslink repair DNA glycosylase YcaQ family protein [Casimicrobiaceae bacterium]|nr:crosslink repair DNA glycosylase YcaQ family protein [Casimicrobiaceae bacterium]